MQEGRITEDDFLSQEEKANKYAFAGAGNYYNPAQNTNEQYTANQNDSANAYYYNPQQHTTSIPEQHKPLQMKMQASKIHHRFILLQMCRVKMNLHKAVHTRHMQITSRKRQNIISRL